MIKTLITFWAIMMNIVVLGQDNNRISVYQGNKDFKNQNFDEASTHYLRAIEKDKKDFKAHYNLGNTLYKKKMYNDAIATYKKALENAKNSEEKSSVLYNIGNAQFQNKNVEDAIKSYKEALKIIPDNEEILRNLRIAKKQHEQQNKQEPQKDKSDSPTEEKKQNNPQNEPKKERNEQEEALIKRIEEKEKQTARRVMQNNGYTSSPSNAKDW